MESQFIYTADDIGLSFTKKSLLNRTEFNEEQKLFQVGKKIVRLRFYVLFAIKYGYCLELCVG